MRPESGLWAHPVELERLVLGHAATEWCAPGQKPVLAGVEDGVYVLGLADRPPRPPAPPLATLTPAEVMAAMRAFIAAPGLWDGTGCFQLKETGRQRPLLTSVIHFA